ncbi:hypothetical protein MRX96_031809 [Rhipicephalus microplus]
MVVADQGNWVADVVIVVEGTANLSPYVESLKSHYIVPTLEYFNGGQIDDRDCGYDSNSTTYALVVFMASDCAPEPAAICHAPTTNVAKLLSWFDRVSFALREPGSVVQKHCILVCNSPPYRLPTLESPMYAGHSVEQLATIMAERQVNFSILSPRKIPALYKLYEKAGGDLQTAMCKNYAKDRRHMVLLRGYQLQERPPCDDASRCWAEAACRWFATEPSRGQDVQAAHLASVAHKHNGRLPPSSHSCRSRTRVLGRAFRLRLPLTWRPSTKPNPPNVTLRPMPDAMNRTTQNRSPVTIAGGAAGTVRLPWSQQPPQGVVSPVVSGGPPVSTPPPPNADQHAPAG